MTTKLTFIEQDWDKQPKRGTSVSEFWRSRGLVALFDTSSATEVISGSAATNKTSLIKSSPLGLAADFSAGTNQQYAHRPAYAIVGDLTIIALVQIRSLNNYSAIIAKQGTTTSYTPYELRLGSNSTDGNTNFVRASSSGFDYTSPGASSILAAGYTGVLALTHKIGQPAVSYVGGKGYTHTSTPIQTPADNGSAVWIGSRYDTVTNLDGRILYVALFNKALNATQIRSITQAPWQLFEPEQIPLIRTYFLTPITGVISAVETSIDTSTFTGILPVKGTITATEVGSDTVNIVSQVITSGTLAGIETSTDIVSFNGLVLPFYEPAYKYIFNSSEKYFNVQSIAKVSSLISTNRDLIGVSNLRNSVFSAGSRKYSVSPIAKGLIGMSENRTYLFNSQHPNNHFIRS